MKTTKRISKTSTAVVSIFKQLTPAEVKEVLRFILFLKTRASIDPEQAYFWTRDWQKKERAVVRDKKLGRVLGDGTVEELLKSLHS